jgi:5-methylcytosine-specific restriction endonuclease McrA
MKYRKSDGYKEKEREYRIKHKLKYQDEVEKRKVKRKENLEWIKSINNLQRVIRQSIKTVNDYDNLINRECRGCHTVRPLYEFARNHKTSYRWLCLQCESKRTTNHSYKKSDRYRIQQRQLRQSEYGRLLGRLRWEKRRARKQLVDETFTKEDAQYIYNQFDNRCYKCGSADKLRIDHHYPLSKGYALTRDNAVLLCNRCNVSKHNHEPEIFYNLFELMILFISYGKRC